MISKKTALASKTLADIVSSDFPIAKVKKIAVKVPKLKPKLKHKLKAGNEKIARQKKEDETFSSLINIVIKSAVEKAKEKKAKAVIEEKRGYTILKDEKAQNASGGYGVASKHYGIAPTTSYIDYGKLFSYLGKFKAKGAYENMNEGGALTKATESSSFVLADKDSMDKIGRYEKYMKSPYMDMLTMALSLVPIAGLSSGEWEEIKMLMKFDPVIYTLKTKTA